MDVPDCAWGESAVRVLIARSLQLTIQTIEVHCIELLQLNMPNRGDHVDTQVPFIELGHRRSNLNRRGTGMRPWATGSGQVYVRQHERRVKLDYTLRMTQRTGRESPACRGPLHADATFDLEQFTDVVAQKSMAVLVG